MKAAEDERTQNEIAELAGLDKTTMVVTLDRLEQAGLVQRRVSDLTAGPGSSTVTHGGALGATTGARRIVRRHQPRGAHSPRRRCDRDGAGARRSTELTSGEGLLATPSHVAPQRRKQVRAGSVRIGSVSTE